MQDTITTYSSVSRFQKYLLRCSENWWTAKKVEGITKITTDLQLTGTWSRKGDRRNGVSAAMSSVKYMNHEDLLEAKLCIVGMPDLGSELKMNIWSSGVWCVCAPNLSCQKRRLRRNYGFFRNSQSRSSARHAYRS